MVYCWYLELLYKYCCGFCDDEFYSALLPFILHFHVASSSVWFRIQCNYCKYYLHFSKPECIWHWVACCQHALSTTTNYLISQISRLTLLIKYIKYNFRSLNLNILCQVGYRVQDQFDKWFISVENNLEVYITFLRNYAFAIAKKFVFTGTLLGASFGQI